MIESSRPAPALRHLIRYYYQLQTHLADNAVVQPVPARSPQAIEFTFGTPYAVHRLDRRSVEPAHAIALVGAQTFRRVDLVMRGAVDAFTIVFQPAGLFMLFGLPGAVLTNDHFDGRAALGSGLGDLERRLAGVRAFADRVRVADGWLSARRPRVQGVSTAASAAAEVLRRSGCIRVSGLAREAGLGIRQFERRFGDEIGIPPKLYARIVRFEAALHRRAAAPGTRWTAIAHSLGYHDQMHMVHDFNRLSGDSPTAIGDRLDMFVKPELDATARAAPASASPPA